MECWLDHRVCVPPSGMESYSMVSHFVDCVQTSVTGIYSALGSVLSNLCGRPVIKLPAYRQGHTWPETLLKVKRRKAEVKWIFEVYKLLIMQVLHLHCMSHVRTLCYVYMFTCVTFTCFLLHFIGMFNYSLRLYRNCRSLITTGALTDEQIASMMFLEQCCSTTGPWHQLTGPREVLLEFAILIF